MANLKTMGIEAGLYYAELLKPSGWTVGDTETSGGIVAALLKNSKVPDTKLKVEGRADQGVSTLDVKGVLAGDVALKASVEVEKSGKGFTLGFEAKGDLGTSSYVMTINKNGDVKGLEGTFQTESGELIGVSLQDFGGGKGTLVFTDGLGDVLGQKAVTTSQPDGFKIEDDIDALAALATKADEKAAKLDPPASTGPQLPPPEPPPPEPSPPERVSEDFDLVGTGSRTLSVELDAGDVFQFAWFFDAEDYLPYDDRAYVNDATLSSVAQVGDFGESGWNTYSFEASADGTYEFVIGIDDQGDDLLASTLQVADVFIL